MPVPRQRALPRRTVVGQVGGQDRVAAADEDRQRHHPDALVGGHVVLDHPLANVEQRVDAGVHERALGLRWTRWTQGGGGGGQINSIN